MMKVLFLDTVHPLLQERLESNGVSCDHLLEGDKDRLKGVIATYEGLVVRSRIPLDRALLQKGERLQFIARSGAGLENIDAAYCREKGIKLFHAPEGNRDAVGEHAIGMLLSMLNNFSKGDREVRRGVWEREGNRGSELGERTVGIIGYGNTGEAFARKLQGFGCRVLAYDKSSGKGEDGLAGSASLEELQREADVISFHVPLTEETRYYFNRGFLERMEKPFYLINTSRGQVVETKSVLEGLRSEKLRGACLDVLEFEKASFERLQGEDMDDGYQELLKEERVILSPHVAGWTHASYRRLSEVLAEKVLKWKEGRG